MRLSALSVNICRPLGGRPGKPARFSLPASPVSALSETLRFPLMSYPRAFSYLVFPEVIE
jgi:hypothetical protein